MDNSINPSIKNILAITLIITMAAFALSVIGYVYSYYKSMGPGSYRTFNVNGEGKITIIPDIAKISFTVTTEGDKDISKLQKENTEKMNKAIAFVKNNGVEEKDIKSLNYDLSPRYQYFQCKTDGACPPSEIIGYTISQSASMKIRDFEKIGIILAGVVENGANSVSQLSFDIDEPATAENQARAQAIKIAKEKAETMASAGEFSIGKLLSIEEQSSETPFYGMDMISKEGIGGGGEMTTAPSIEPGSQEVKINVTLQYEIK